MPHRRARSLVAGGRTTAVWRGLLVLALVLLAERAQAQASTPTLLVQLDSALSQARQQQLLGAVAAQLLGLARVELADGSTRSPQLGLVSVMLSGPHLTLRFAPADPRLDAAPRIVPGPLDEASASEIASIVHAYVATARESAERVPATPRSPALPADGGTLELVSAEGVDAGAHSPDAAVSAARPSARANTPSSNDAPATTATSAPGPTSEARASSPPKATSVSDRKRARRLQILTAAPRESDQRDAPLATQHARLRLLGAYSGSSPAPELPWRHGLRVEGSLTLSRVMYVGAGYVLAAPVELDGATASARIVGQGGVLFAGMLRSYRTLALAADLGFQATHVRRQTLAALPELGKTRDSRAWEPGVSLRLHLLLRVAGAERLTLDLAPAVELALSRRPLVVEDVDQDVRPLLSPRLVRPRLDLGASFDVL